jgi:hypothetical protein
MPKSVTVHMPEFILEAREGDQVKKTIIRMSFGVIDGDPSDLTPIMEGMLPADARDPDHESSRYILANGRGAPMPFSLFFDPHPACAFHAADTFTPSHGCIHLEDDDAEWLFNWAEGEDVSLSIKGPYPASPVRAAVYKVDGENMLGRVIREIKRKLGLNEPYDDEYDQATADAIRLFQSAEGFREGDIDGKVGKQTAAALGITL